jgi:hypothetical protein
MPEFNDRTGNRGTGKGRLVDISHVGIGEEQRKFNRTHLTQVAGTLAYGNFVNGTKTADIKGMSVSDAEKFQKDRGMSLPVDGDALAKVVRKKTGK